MSAPFRRVASRLFLLLLVSGSVRGAFAQNPLSFSVEDSARKITSGVLLSGSQAASIEAARNEFEAFQIVLYVETKTLKILDVLAEDLVGPSGRISAEYVSTFYEAPIKVIHRSSVESQPATNLYDRDFNAPQYIPDPLLPFHEKAVTLDYSTGSPQFILSDHGVASPVEISKGGRITVWVEVFVPPATSPGRYQGSIRIDTNEGKVVVPMSLEVWGVSIGSSASERMPTFVRISLGGVCSKHFGTAGCDANAIVPLNDLYARFLLQHRISVELWSPAVRTSAKYAQAYRHLWDPLANPLMFPMAGAKLSAIKYPWFDGEHGEIPNDLQVENWWNDIAVGEGIRSKVFASLVDEPLSDEAKWETIVRQAKVIRDNSGLMTMVASDRFYLESLSNRSPDFIQDRAYAAVDILSAIVQHIDGSSPGNPSLQGDQTQQYVDFRDNGSKKLWGYQSCFSHSCMGLGTEDSNVGWPSLVVDASGPQARAEPWMHFIYGLDGMYYYEVADWSGLGADPRFADADLWSGFAPSGYTGNGDGILVYPYSGNGIEHFPIASLRLKMLRDGLEDYELLTQCAEKNARRARQIADSVFPMDGLAPSGVRTGSMFHAASLGSSDSLIATRIRMARRSLADCIGWKPGTIPEFLLVDEVLSPPILSEPILECSKGIDVGGIVPGAGVRVFVNDVLVKTTSNSGGTIFLRDPLSTGEKVSVSQVVRGTESGRSNAVTVAGAPDPLPAPVLVGDLFACAEGVKVRTLTGVGTEIQVVSKAGVPSWEATEHTYWTGYVATSPLQHSDTVGARSFVCSGPARRESAWSSTRTVGGISPVYPRPTTWQFFEGTSLFLAENTLSGSAFELAWTPADIVTFRGLGMGFVYANNRGFGRNEIVRVRQYLCSGLLSDSDYYVAPVADCENVPQATPLNPRAGDQIIQFSNWVPGATIRVIEKLPGGGQRMIADGGGSEVATTEPLTLGATLDVYQTIEPCGRSSLTTAAVTGP